MKLVVIIAWMISGLSANLYAGVIKGNIRNSGKQRIFIKQLLFGDKRTDSIEISDEKPGFEWTYEADRQDLYILKFEKKGPDFFLVLSGEDIEFDVDLNVAVSLHTLCNSIIVKGSSATQQFYEIEKYLYLIKKAIVKTNEMAETFYKDADSVARRLLISQIATFENLRNNYLYTIVNQTHEPVIAYYSMRILKISRDVPDLMYKDLYYKNYQRFDPAYFSGLGVEKGSLLKNEDNIVVNTVFPDFKMPGINGKEIALSDFKGKYILVDFWASWCVPCRKESPNLIKAYELFKEKEFTIISISLDFKKENWIEAIQKDKLEKWTHVSELNGGSNSLTQEYNISRIPFNILLDPELKVIEKNLHGDALHEKLKYYLNQ